MHPKALQSINVAYPGMLEQISLASQTLGLDRARGLIQGSGLPDYEQIIILKTELIKLC